MQKETITTPLTDQVIADLHVGDRLLLNGLIYTARDAAHQRLVAALTGGQPLPIPLAGQVIYYVGPAPARPDQIIGPAGPTTASRMDPYTPQLLAQGLKGMIGKGKRNKTVREAMVNHRSIYFVTVGGAAALIAEQIKSVELVAYPDLGPEAIYRFEIESFPVVVANDAYGADLFEQGQATYRRSEVLS